MTFPQKPAHIAIIEGQDIWRLYTDLESSGDIYPSDISALALVVGPNSDIGRVAATYFDPTAKYQIGSAEFSVDKPWVGRMDSRPAEKYITSDFANILISSVDLAPPLGFRPPLAGENDPMELVPPKIDVLFYVKKPPTGVIAARSDRLHLFEQIPDITSVDPQWYLVPYYNRKNAQITCKNLSFVGAADITVDVYGINFSNVIEDASITDNGHQQELLDTMVISAGATQSSKIQNCYYDYLAIKAAHVGAFVDTNQLITHIVTTDKV